MELDSPDKNKNNNNSNDSLIQEDNIKDKIENLPTNQSPLVISPVQSEKHTIIIQPSVLENKESLKAKIGEVLESVKENASNIIDKVVKTEEQDINSFKRDTPKLDFQDKEQQQQQQRQQSNDEFVIPVVGEKYTFSKKMVSEDISIEKRWEEKDEVKIPIRYEKLFVNDKEIDVYSKHGILSQIKEKISDLVQSDNNITRSSNSDNKDKVKKKENDDNSQNETNNKEIEKQKIEAEEEPQLKGEMIPLFDNQQIENNRSEILSNNVTNNNKFEILIPLYAEEVTVSKKMVKVGEIAISKRKIVEDENVDVDTIKEQITIEHADGRKEKISDY